MPKAIVSLSAQDGSRTTIQSRDHTYYLDEPIEQGGTNTAPTPTEAAMAALGSCIAITMKLYADRKKWPVERIEVEVDFERFKASDYADYQGDAAFVHEIREKIAIYGPIDADQRQRLLEIGEKCPVRRLIELPAFFKHEDMELVAE